VYSVRELELIDPLQSDDYAWETGQASKRIESLTQIPPPVIKITQFRRFPAKIA
jgi:hypothetical protein